MRLVIYFHAFAASVAQSSLVIKSPRSMLAPHAWSQLNEAVAIFETAGATGAPVAAFVPRLRILRDKAYLSLQNVISVPLGLSAGQPPADVADSLAEGTDASLFILGPPTRLERKQRKKHSLSARGSSAGDGMSPDGASPSTALAQMLGGAPALSEQAPPVAMLAAPGGPESQAYHPLDAPILPRQQLAAATTQAAAAKYLAAVQHPAHADPYPPQPLYHHPPPQPYPGSSYASPASAGPSTGPQTPTTQAYVQAAAQAAAAQAAAAQAATSGAARRASAASLYDPSDLVAQQRFSAHAPLQPQQGPLASLNSAFFPSPPLASASSSAAGSYAPHPQGTFAPAPVPYASPQFTFANFATAFPLAAVGGEAVGTGGAGAPAQAGMVEQGTQAHGMGGGGDGWAWFDVLGGTGGAPSPLDFSRFTE
ncbi:hypothetical protein JCM10449v2_004494 [Rhodotorula kratochvilovae]